MKSKQLVCNDCGCRFEIKDAKESVPQTASTDKLRGKVTGKASDKSGESKTTPVTLSCPECRSYNVTTA